MSPNIPADIIYPIIQNLHSDHDRKDLYAATLVNWTFNRAATRLLYAMLDLRSIKEKDGRLTVLHPATTLLAKPELTRYVRHIHETGDIHKTLAFLSPATSTSALTSLTLCTNLQSFSWVDNTFSQGRSQVLFMSFLLVLKTLHSLQDLTIRTSDGPEQLWSWILGLVLGRKGGKGQTSMPRSFMLGLAKIHKETLKIFGIGTTQLSLDDVEFLCGRLKRLEELVCSTSSLDAAAISQAVSKASHLQTLKLQVLSLGQGFLGSGGDYGYHSAGGYDFSGSGGRRGGTYYYHTHSDLGVVSLFRVEHAWEMMVRSRLRVVWVGAARFRGQWVPNPDGNREPSLEVSCMVDRDRK
ncbi:hypothetical protein JAAARDRAFT_79458 [Jaapia argillacea MUCL 33604]|uniref:F-box domain-containing protein n=1 Tax=Jaapia argillacea MUCL 33604 TaxID=933084 RepID=A0A067PP11_9AGAM|nr:hypothetical protein JAAARDRAFT_79458 [Jaapia argillacea MUCL 33604]